MYKNLKYVLQFLDFAVKGTNNYNEKISTRENVAGHTYVTYSWEENAEELNVS